MPKEILSFVCVKLSVSVYKSISFLRLVYFWEIVIFFQDKKHGKQSVKAEMGIRGWCRLWMPGNS